MIPGSILLILKRIFDINPGMIPMIPGVDTSPNLNHG